MHITSQTLFEAQGNSQIKDWQTLNDGVMGGISESQITQGNSGNLIFWGTVRLEYNGGFASIRHQFPPLKVTDKSKVVLRLKGDGKTYKFRLKSSTSQRHSYIQEFNTNGEWQVIQLLFEEFYPSFRGNILDRPNYPGAVLEEIAILIGNKRHEQFRLEIEKIVLH
jgi:hypothetical protein